MKKWLLLLIVMGVTSGCIWHDHDHDRRDHDRRDHRDNRQHCDHHRDKYCEADKHHDDDDHHHRKGRKHHHDD